MKHVLSQLLIVMTMASVALAAGTVEVKATDGSIWRGDVNDAVEVVWTQKGVEQTIIGTLTRAERSYIVVNGEFLGKSGDITIFRADIARMSSADPSKVKTPDVVRPADTTKASPKDTSTPAGKTEDGKSIVTVSEVKRTIGKDGKPYLPVDKPGVFLLPLEGMVGETFRKEEIKAIGEEADRYGPGQIIVLRIKSGGGSVLEMDEISDILFDIRERHRIVAWIEEAISAACFTALHCNEIYFKTNGAAGAMTMWSGGPGGARSAKGAELQGIMRRMSDVAERGGRSSILARSMVHAPLICTYDKDEKTGKVTFYDTMQGKYVLSDAVDNLTLTSSQAVHCGFAQGIADTEAELAKFLGLSEWHEISTYGRDIQKKWVDTVERAKIEVPALLDKYQLIMGSPARDDEVKIGNAIQVFRELKNWRRRAPNAVDMMGIPPDENLDRLISEHQYQLAQLKKRQRPNTR